MRLRCAGLTVAACEHLPLFTKRAKELGSSKLSGRETATSKPKTLPEIGKGSIHAVAHKFSELFVAVQNFDLLIIGKSLPRRHR